MQIIRKVKVKLLPIEKENQLLLKSDRRCLCYKDGELFNRYTNQSYELYFVSNGKFVEGDVRICYLTNMISQITDVRVQCGLNDGILYEKLVATACKPVEIIVIPKGFKSGVGALSHKYQIVYPFIPSQFVQEYVEAYNKGTEINELVISM